MMPNQITAHNAGWRIQFRFAVSGSGSGVCEYFRSALPRHALGFMVFGLRAGALVADDSGVTGQT
jgi:hypothetical protein